MKNTKIKWGGLLLALAVSMTACKKDFLDTAPTDDVASGTIFETTQGAMVALNGTYRTMYQSLTNHGNFGQKSYDLVADLMGEDMVVHKQGYGWFNRDYFYTDRAVTTPNSRSDRMWFYYYRLINNANLILAGLEDAVGPDNEKELVRGQALAIRANSYYYLVNFFQQSYKGNESAPGVPVYTEPTSEGVGRGTVQEVYDRILADLTEAEQLLEGKGRVHMSHINQATVRAIRARVALVMEDWENAARYANLARSGYDLMSRSDYTTTGFNSVSNGEWIWGLEVNVEQSTIFASFYSHMDVASGGYADLGTQKKITKFLYDQIGDDDVRKQNFIALDAPNASQDRPPLNQTKFKLRVPGVWDSDYLLIRASEMYLIEAEALARTGGNAASVLEELVKSRDAGYTTSGLSGQALIDEVLLQRRIELWGEGVSLFDVKRLGKGLNRVTGAGNHNGSDLVPGDAGVNLTTEVVTLPAESPRFLMRIPQDEINANSALSSADQNP